MAGTQVRRAGRAGLRDGSVLLWSIAEGARGARWRASVRRGDALLSDLLLEVGTDGRPGRLEITTAAGQLTLHPEPDGLSAHGNVVSAEGVRPLAHRWTGRHWFACLPNPLVGVAMCRALRAEVGVGERRRVPVLAVDGHLIVRPGELIVSRPTDVRWSIEGAHASGWDVSLLADGLPAFERGEAQDGASGLAETWPLEVQDEP